MSRGRPRHQSSRRRMYSPRQRDVRERRNQHLAASAPAAEEAAPLEVDESIEFESPSGWGFRLGPRASAA